LRRVFGLRFLLEAAFIVLVAALVWHEDLSSVGIFGAIGGAWLVVALAEWVVSRQGRELPRVEEPTEPEEPEPVVAPALLPEPRHVRVVAPPPEPEPEPAPEPEPEPEPAPEPPPEPAERVVAFPASGGPREWNLWELERMTREVAGADAARDEERSFLLMYLREFADPDGMLPVTFDSLVWETFGDLLGAARP